MNRKAAMLLASFFGMAATSYSTAARSSEAPQQYDRAVLAQVEAFYGISEEAAIVRLDSTTTSTKSFLCPWGPPV